MSAYSLNWLLFWMFSQMVCLPDAADDMSKWSSEQALMPAASAAVISEPVSHLLILLIFIFIRLLVYQMSSLYSPA